MLRKIFFVGAVLVLMLALFGSTVLAAGDGDPDKGKTLWAANNCKSCHGANGEGKYAGPRAGDGKTAEDWIKQARTPKANMPAYDAVHVSDVDLTDMWAYMQTLPKPASFSPVVYTPQAGDPEGKLLFNQKRCVACHGDGAGLVKSRFTDNGRTVAVEAVLKQLRTPAQRMPMFNTTQVSDVQAGQVADYLKSLDKAAPAAGTGAAPKTLPVAGGQLPLGILSVALIVAGLAVFGLGLTLARRRT